ncbi:M4 family metallopeptidase [Bordetella genomosp. 11]|uniref:Neutral metalloproteinase n=1 Tax=Bordetella genomosp. 11 TaxID=1416808 RepID=A0A261UEH1_9BORD|nr:M4 family metallopeptidase [Bordetella genomosp. 11]OZI59630.1 peptidase M4 family protein [Bordetella genomosp. 11]
MRPPRFRMSRHAVVPPYLLNRLARQGSPHVRACATTTLTLIGDDGSLRGAAQALARTPAARPADGAARRVHTAEGGTALPGRPVRAEGQAATGDPATDEAYDYLGATHALFAEVYGRDSIDGKGMALVGTVHYGQHYDNAFWNGAQMVFGDGDGEVFNRFTIAMDVVGHELSHGVIDHEAALVYRDQAGALNESISDVFGVLVKQYRLGHSVDQADWLIGAGLFTEAVRARGLRSMRAPGTAYDDPLLGRDPQPAHMRDFIHTEEDNGGVHLNSGIPNRAFYLAASALGGHAWEQAGRIWYDALCDPTLARDANFAAFASLTLKHAVDAGAQAAVRQAWHDVGVLP